MKYRNGVITLFLAYGLTGCLSRVSYNPGQAQPANAPETSDVKPVTDPDHPRSDNIVEVEPEPEVEEMEQEQEVENTELSQADILALDTVTITGNADLLENSAQFASRYVDPNGKPLNAQANILTLKEGQTLSVCNDENAQNNLRVHTGGSPFPHGGNIGAGECVDYTLNSVVEGNGNNIYDHNLGRSNGVSAYPIFIKVVSAEDAQAIIDAAAEQ